jgi:hypothetical protein
MADLEEKQESNLSEKNLSPEELKKRKERNLAIALALGAFVILVFIVTVVRLGGSVAERSF